MKIFRQLICLIPLCSQLLGQPTASNTLKLSENTDLFKMDVL